MRGWDGSRRPHPTPRQTLQSGLIKIPAELGVRIDGRAGEQKPTPFATLDHAGDVVKKKLGRIARLAEFNHPGKDNAERLIKQFGVGHAAL
jgi:hypothetical protein